MKLLFVCMGNICRSPMAEGAFQARVDAAGLGDVISCDSAGTIGYHAGNPPDSRGRASAMARGIDISHQRSRKVRAADFDEFDYILAMDHANYRDLMDLASTAQNARAQLAMFLDFAPHLNTAEVPDPYYGGDDGFEHVLDLVDAASDGLLAHVMQQHLSR